MVTKNVKFCWDKFTVSVWCVVRGRPIPGSFKMEVVFCPKRFVFLFPRTVCVWNAILSVSY